MISAFISAVSNAVEVIQGKYILSRERVPFKVFITLQNVMIFLATAIGYIFWGRIDFGALDWRHLLVFAAIIPIAYIYNYLFGYAIKMGKMCNVEPIAMTSPLITMIIAVIVYPDERNFYVLIPALIAGLALVLPRLEKKHFKINKYTLAISGFAILFAVENNLAKYILEVFSPIAFYTIRVGIISALFLIFLRPNLRKVSKKSFINMSINGFIIAVEYTFYYTAIHQIGLVNTSLIMLLAPVLILVVSNYLFSEKTTVKKAISDAIVLICIAVAILIK